MRAQPITTPPVAQTAPDDQVKTTVIKFPNALLTKSATDKLCILTASGLYTKELGKEIERACFACSHDIGLELSNITTNKTSQTKFDTTILGFLRNIKTRFKSNNQQFLLCTPPSELVDLLILTGTYQEYTIVDNTFTTVPYDKDENSSTTPKNKAKCSSETQKTHPTITRQIIELNTSLKRTAILEKGLETADRCVKHFLPQAPPRAEGYNFSVFYKSSETVGGDFFDFVALSANTLGILIGDVSGHGLEAAILMGLTKKEIALRAKDHRFTTPRDDLIQANVDLYADFTKYNFATALYGTLDLSKGTFTFARAGHELPILLNTSRVPTTIESKGIPIGVAQSKLFSTALTQETITIPPGGYALLITDGITECWSPRGETFGRQRLLFTLSQAPRTLSCQDFLDNVLASVMAFAATRPQEDDMTALLIQRI